MGARLDSAHLKACLPIRVVPKRFVRCCPSRSCLLATTQLRLAASLWLGPDSAGTQRGSREPGSNILPHEAICTPHLGGIRLCDRDGTLKGDWEGVSTFERTASDSLACHG